jgi:hypothetical protein
MNIKAAMIPMTITAAIIINAPDEVASSVDIMLYYSSASISYSSAFSRICC